MALSFAGNGTIAGLSVGGLPDGTVDEDTLANNAVASGKLASGVGGKVLQVVQTHNVTGVSQSLSAGTVANITNLNATITPATTSSKILVIVSWAGEGSANIQNLVLGLKRGSTVIGSPTSEGSRTPGIMPVAMSHSGNYDSTLESAMYQYLDSPSSTSATTYYATAECGYAITFYTCRTVSDTNDAINERPAATITLMEIGA